MKLIRLTAAAALAALASSAVFAESMPPAPTPKGTHLGNVIVNPYGFSPLTAVINRNTKHPTDIRVTVKGKPKGGVDITYDVGRSTLLSNDGIPVFGLYPDYRNTVVVSYKLDGRAITDTYSIVTPALPMPYMDNRNITALPQPKVTKLDTAFRDRLYLVNSGTRPPKGSEVNWIMPKTPQMSKSAANPSGGSLAFETIPLNYVVDTQGEFRWWLEPQAIYDGINYDIADRGYAMGFFPTKSGTYTFVQGQRWIEMNLAGRIVAKHPLPPGYIDLSHASWEMPNGNILLRAAKYRYHRPDGQIVQSVRDFIIEVDRSGNVIDEWDLNTILDPTRDALIKNLDLGAVCMNVDLDAQGKAVGAEPLAPFGDAAGVGTGRNWAHVNSVAYDESDDSIIISARHQGVMKIGRDKEVKWILAPSEGWKNGLEKKLLKPVDKDGRPLKCSSTGDCEGGFDFTYTQHAAWPRASKNGTIVVFDNGQVRHYEQPALPEMNYSRVVEYKIDPKTMTVKQTWAYGKDRGYESFAPITSNAAYQADKDTMFGFYGSVGLFDQTKGTIGRLQEVDYKTGDVKVEIDVYNNKASAPHYQGHIIDLKQAFAK